MLTGKLPFQGRTQQEMMIARLRSDPMPIRRMRPELDEPIVFEGVPLKFEVTGKFKVQESR